MENWAYIGQIILKRYLKYRGTLLVAQLVEALLYKSEDHGFGFLWCQ